ncbi:MAG: hypothetical protein Q7O66_05190, partial [Dehalococcoidia bacterium]|nr:hypothetical protein [Dehalococcoidia bacterium]
MVCPVKLYGGVLAAIIGLTVAAMILAFGGAVWAVILVGLSGLGTGLGAYRHSLGRGKRWLGLL